MKVSKLFLALFISSFVSLNSFAEVDTAQTLGGWTVENDISKGISSSGLSINIPVHIKDDVVYVANIGYLNSETDTGYYDSRGRAHSDGAANYLHLGGEARTYLLDKKWLEGTIGARYGLRLGGTTEYSNYSQDNDGSIYDPQGGGNVSVGINLIGKLSGNRNRAVVIGAKYEANLSGGDGEYILSISYRH